MTSRLAQNSVVINGSSSGSATIAPPAAAGTPTLTLPTSSGTLALTSQIPAAGVTSLNGQTGAITNTDINAIGSYVWGRPQNGTSYSRNGTIAGSSLYSQAGQLIWNSEDANWQYPGVGNSGVSGDLINTGTWRCMGKSPVLFGNTFLPCIWVRIS